MASDIANQDEFATLLERHRRILFKVANSWCPDPEDRADLAQEIATQLWRAWPSWDRERLFSTWMYRIALNVAISHVRRSGRRAATVPLDEALMHTLADYRDNVDDGRIRELYQVIDRLDPLNRALLLLYLDEHTYGEIAAILGISETNAGTKIGRLKKRIADEMKGR